MKPATEKQLTCPHENFFANVAVARITDTRTFMADVTIHCEDCGLPFSFNGLPGGLNHDGAACSVDGTEARLSISPGIGGLFVPKE
jgi:hypothetical protein